ncbi:unnamed protein product [Durusdinium trenchii]|uniref:Uncharacterized protein n=1 Tax=Durusdinium trenchii TaxID=1381693 RepID=A0ABP0HUX0_9DINO
MAPKKRTSGGQPQAQKQKKAKAGEIMGAPADSLALAHMSLFESWMNLGQQMNNKSYFLGKNTHGKTLIQFTTRKEHVLDKNLTVDALLTQHLADEAMCSFEFVRIACKLGVSQATAFGFYKFLEEKFPPTSGEDLSFEDGSLAGPGSVYMVKGWHRSICCLTVCYAAFMVPEMLEASDGIANFASCYALGKQECGAAVNLLTKIPGEVKDCLTLLVQRYTQSRFITHEQLQRVCGGFLACLDQFTSLVPPGFANGCLADIHKTFELRHGDADIIQLLETSVPPAGLHKISIFSGYIQKYHSQGALDFKHISDRFQKGKEWASEYLEKKHRLCLAAICASWNSAAFVKSKALLGSICDVARSRVVDLVNPDPERALAPHWRVQQRGVQATAAILKNLVEGVATQSPHPLLVVDLLPSRFSEWSLASWSIQRELLQDASKDLDVRFLATYHSDSVADLTAAKEALMGRLINDFWDSSEAAGSKRRECTTFSQPLPSLETLVVTDDGELNLENMADLARVQGIKVGITTDNHIWLLNKIGNGTTLDFSAGEIFGFNIGSYSEVTLGSAEPSDSHIPWLVKLDKTLVALADTKEIKSIAEILCDVTKQRGITEIRIVDHALQPKVGADQRPLAYRYDISPMNSVNAYKPKELPSDCNRLGMRSVQLGACFHSKYSQLRGSQLCGLVWEVKVDDSVPATLKPIKPKFYLLGSVSIKDGHAIKLN